MNDGSLEAAIEQVAADSSRQPNGSVTFPPDSQFEAAAEVKMMGDSSTHQYRVTALLAFEAVDASTFIVRPR